MSERGIIIDVSGRSSRWNTLRTIWRSCCSITPASTPSSRLCAISSSVMPRASVVSIAQQLEHGLRRRRQQLARKGRRRAPASAIGRATHARHRLGIELADPLGHQLAEDDGDEGDARSPRSPVAATPDESRRPGRSSCSQSASASLNAASPTMPFRMPMEVMPTCTVDRKRVGCSISRSAAAAPASPASAIAARRALRLDASAISDMANTPLSTVSSAISRTSMNSGRESDTMALYLIGDVQGCDAPLGRLLREDRFLPEPRHAATCWATWSTAARSRRAVLRRLMSYGRLGASACWATTT